MKCPYCGGLVERDKGVSPSADDVGMFRNRLYHPQCYTKAKEEPKEKWPVNVEKAQTEEGAFNLALQGIIDYYNSFVIHPMFIQMIEIMEKNNIPVPVSSKVAIERMQKFNIFLERLISPEGKFPAFGRSIVYRLGIFQSLALSIWKYGLPYPLTNGGVRSALTE